MLLSGSAVSVELTNAELVNNEFYEVTVDAQTEVGFNGSLPLQSVILPSGATGTAAELCKIIVSFYSFLQHFSVYSFSCCFVVDDI